MPALDHLIFLSKDLDADAAVAAEIGFTMMPTGRHPKLGTCNRLAMLDHTYVELLAVEQVNERTATYTDWLERKTGIVGLAIAGSATEEFQRLSAAGVSIDPPISFERPVDAGGKQELARFTIARIVQGQTPGAFAFICEHHTPHLVWQSPARHANGFKDVARLRWLCRDAQAVAGSYAALIGSEVDTVGDTLRVRLENTDLEFVEQNEQGDLSGGDYISDGEDARMIAVEFAGSDNSQWQSWPGMGVAYRSVRTAT